MGLGNKRGHVHGSKVSGGHSTLIDGADAVVKKLGVLPWFESVRPGVISVARGGTLSLTIRRPADGTHVNTLKLIFRTKGSVQEVYLHVREMGKTCQPSWATSAGSWARSGGGRLYMTGRLTRLGNRATKNE